MRLGFGEHASLSTTHQLGAPASNLEFEYWQCQAIYLDHIPKPLATMGEKVSHQFLGLLAKWAKATIIPPSSFKTIRRPNPIANGQPRKKLDLWSRPSFPNQLVGVCKSSSEELSLISRA
jgi:hypothetical protein